MTTTSSARLELIGAAVLFSTGGAAIKWADFSGWQSASFRSGIAALALLLMTPAAHAFLSKGPFSLAYVFVTDAIQVGPAPESSVILLVGLVLNPVWAWVVQREAPGEWAVLGGGGAIIVGATTLKNWMEGRGRVTAPVT